jgi:dipeptidyl aminopeptidase/acylaminoacyl peptidase
LELLVADTHKFEAHYLTQLVGPYPENRSTYTERSPIHFTDQLSCPLLLFQGLLDKVVPPDQARIMEKAVRKKGIAVNLIEYPDEAHGFRSPATIEHMLETELDFYQKNIL